MIKVPKQFPWLLRGSFNNESCRSLNSNKTSRYASNAVTNILFRKLAPSI